MNCYSSMGWVLSFALRVWALAFAACPNRHGKVPESVSVTQLRDFLGDLEVLPAWFALVSADSQEGKGRAAEGCIPEYSLFFLHMNSLL